MDKITQLIEKFVLPLAQKISSQRHLKAVQNTFLSTMPFMMIGSIALILMEPPIQLADIATSNIFYGLIKAWHTFASFAGPSLGAVFNVTLGSLSLYVTVGVAYFLSKHYQKEAFLPMMLATGSFLLLAAPSSDGALDLTYFDGKGLFIAIVIALVTTEIYDFLVSHKIGEIKMPEGVPSALAESFTALVPALIIMILVTALNTFCHSVLHVSFPDVIILIIKPLILFVDNVFGVAFASLLTQILWWFGIHDTAVGAVLMPIRDANFAANASAYASGISASNLPYIYSGPFWWVFCAIGGSGATLGLAFMLLTSQSKQLKTIGKLSAIPALFNINEPLIFGLPIMLNPLMLFPFLLAQTLNAVITYLLMSTGLVAIPFAEPGWNMFAPIAAFLATFDVKAVVLAIGLIILDALVYFPFFKVMDRNTLAQEMAASNKE